MHGSEFCVGDLTCNLAATFGLCLILVPIKSSAMAVSGEDMLVTLFESAADLLDPIDLSNVLAINRS